jgi:hypothetical protein
MSNALDEKLKNEDFLEGMKELQIEREDLLDNYAINSTIAKKDDKITALKRKQPKYSISTASASTICQNRSPTRIRFDCHHQCHF